MLAKQTPFDTSELAPGSFITCSAPVTHNDAEFPGIFHKKICVHYNGAIRRCWQVQYPNYPLQK
jgi:hypothetical protein